MEAVAGILGFRPRKPMLEVVRTDVLRGAFGGDLSWSGWQLDEKNRFFDGDFSMAKLNSRGKHLMSYKGLALAFFVLFKWFFIELTWKKALWEGEMTWFWYLTNPI